MDGRLTLITPPSQEPILPAAAKLYCRCMHNQEDELFVAWIASARDYVQDATKRQLMPATWKLTLGSFPLVAPDAGTIHGSLAWHEGEDEIVFPITPVLTVSVQYYDAGNVLQTWATDQYELVAEEAWAVLIPATGVDWPETYDRTDAVQITFGAGYEEGQVPPKLISAMYLRILADYQRRGLTKAEQESIEALLDLDTTRRYS